MFRFFWQYLEQRVLNHNYIQMSPEAQKIVTRAYRFVSDFDAIDWMKNSDQDLSLLVPRLPYDILFAIGGWFEGSACSLFEVYDCRADRWIKFNYGDPHGPRAYHSSVVIGNHIYCIGGYSGSEYYNRCTMFDLDTKTWKEVLKKSFLMEKFRDIFHVYIIFNNFFFFIKLDCSDAPQTVLCQRVPCE